MYETPNSQALQQTQVLYMETSIQPGLTIAEYRRSRPRPSRWERLKRLAGGAQAATA